MTDVATDNLTAGRPTTAHHDAVSSHTICLPTAHFMQFFYSPLQLKKLRVLLEKRDHFKKRNMGAHNRFGGPQLWYNYSILKLVCIRSETPM
ncbi:hypothetical protein JTE90_001166 [Oedothorax gibbosus]|uniref:Uncharacterized protein n=1 Tax=Oedothorax gibbosus TaxID=931172 RepID=A0AAV6VIS3_9ARAC|nr:hypothetical protein JTE90_001166 [Oedothorax gibbosus]